MVSSTYFKKVIDDILDNIDKTQIKIARYKEIERILEKISSSLTDPIENMNSAERNFENGGYYVGGQTPANSALKNSAKKLLEAKDKLEIIINKTNRDIAIFETEIKRLEQQLESAIYNYNEALKKEMV